VLPYQLILVDMNNGVIVERFEDIGLAESRAEVLLNQTGNPYAVFVLSSLHYNQEKE
jgi:hypothetical protein